MTRDKHPAAVALGSIKSPAKTAACRKNAKLPRRRKYGEETVWMATYAAELGHSLAGIASQLKIDRRTVARMVNGTYFAKEGGK